MDNQIEYPEFRAEDQALVKHLHGIALAFIPSMEFEISYSAEQILGPDIWGDEASFSHTDLGRKLSALVKYGYLPQLRCSKNSANLTLYTKIH